MLQNHWAWFALGAAVTVVSSLGSVCQSVGALACVLGFSFFAFAAMAEAWAKILEEEGLSPDLREKITSTYKDANVFRSCFHHASDIDKYAQKLLTSGATPVATEEDWSFHPAAGALRRIREKSMVTHQPAAAVAAGVPPGSSNLLPLVQPLVANCKLNDAERERLIKEFGKKYPGVCLAPSVLPSLGYLQLVQAQCTGASWGWHPWRKILSEAAVGEVQSRKGYQKREMVDLVAEAAGLCSDEWDQELQAAPMKVFQLLCAEGAICIVGCPTCSVSLDITWRSLVRASGIWLRVRQKRWTRKFSVKCFI